MATTAEHVQEKTKGVSNTVVWFDLPVDNLERAMRFYSAVLDAPVHKQEHGGIAFAVLNHEPGDISGCLIPNFKGNENKPSDHGPLLYLNCQGRLDEAVSAAEATGGKVIQPRHPIGPYGFRAIILDSEGNRIALHSS